MFTGFQIYKYLLPGEIVLVNENGLKEVKTGLLANVLNGYLVKGQM